ncbi:MAG: sterol desaturase family protein [Cyanobacteria bacterium SBLK]|nr:sterol desaturase family protein [Cyanobacteria bacterium SBLK]
MSKFLGVVANHSLRGFPRDDFWVQLLRIVWLCPFKQCHYFADNIHPTFLFNLANIMVHFCEWVFESLPSRLQSLLFLLLPLFDLHNRLAWFYILGFLVIAACLYWFSPDNSKDRAWGKFFNDTFPPALYVSHSFRLDWQCYLINGLLKVALNLSVASIAMAIALSSRQIFESIFGVSPLRFESNLLLILIHTFFSIAIFDLGTYCAHYCLHKVPLLWEFHRVHHAAEGLTPITGFRDHPIDVAFKKTIKSLFLGIYLGGFNYLTKGQIDTVTVDGTLIILFLFDFTINFRHSHLWISYGWHLEHIFSSPILHQIHHSQKEIHLDKNLAEVFSFWDYLFGTLYVPTQREQLIVGIPGERDYENIWQLYFQPFTKAWKKLHHSAIASNL